MLVLSNQLLSWRLHIRDWHDRKYSVTCRGTDVFKILLKINPLDHHFYHFLQYGEKNKNIAAPYMYGDIEF